MKNNKAHNTAISRKCPSKPMKNLEKYDLLKGKLLDFGCGRGFDANHYDMDRYDPHYAPEKPKGKYDTITCNYVLNVVEEDHLQGIVDSILKHLKKKGTAYLSVRRDIKNEGYTSKGTYQRNVKLELPILRENGAYCTYILTKETSL